MRAGRRGAAGPAPRRRPGGRPPGRVGALGGVSAGQRDVDAWALARTDDPTVDAALAIRHGDPSRSLDPAGVDAFQRRVLDRMEHASKQED